MALDDANELKGLIETQGKTFEAFKATMEELKKADGLTEEKLAKIEKSLDDAVEAKAKIEAKLEAERKEREDLELRLTRPTSKGKQGEVDEVKAFNLALRAFGKRDEVDAKGFDAYREGFANFLRKDARLLDTAEIKAMSVGSDPDGGYLVTPDMSGRIVTKVYESSPIRQIASVAVISTDALEGIEDTDEAGFEWVGETQTRSDTSTPQIGKWSIPVHELSAMPKMTQKLLDDASVDVEGWLSGKVADKLARAENAAFVTGNGINKPRGFADYTTAADSGSGVTWGTIGHVMSGASADFAASTPADKLFDLMGLVKEAYLPNSRWVTRRSVITKIRKFKESTTNGYIWQPGLQAGVPESLLGYPITRAEDVPALAADSLSLWFGDFRAGYQIVDRTGIRVLRDPYTAKPYVVFYTTKRVGGGVVNFEAIKAMKFNT
jgi:HK97 family phage major capsid protein